MFKSFAESQSGSSVELTLKRKSAGVMRIASKEKKKLPTAPEIATTPQQILDEWRVKKFDLLHPDVWYTLTSSCTQDVGQGSYCDITLLQY